MENRNTARLKLEYEEFYACGDFQYYSPRITANVLRAVMDKAEIAPGTRILDLGCGSGYYSSILDGLGYPVTGLDFSAQAIEKAKRRNTRCEFFVGDARSLSFEPGSFRCILLSGCSLLNTFDIESIREFLDGVLRVLAPGGKLLIIHGGDLTGSRSSPDSWSNHTWAQLQAILPSAGVTTILYCSHFRIIGLIGTAGLNPILTRCLRFAVPKLHRHIFQFIEKLSGAS